MIDLLLPLAPRRRKGEQSDLLRLKTLLASTDMFWSGGNRLVIVTPDVADVSAEVERLQPKIAVDVLHDDEVFAGFPDRLSSWWKQQVLKLAANRVVQTDFYLVLDADCFFVEPTTEEDLTPGGRGRVSFGEGPAYSHRSWYRGCSKMGLPVPTKAVNVTPFVMHRVLASYALAFVSGRPEGAAGIGKLGWSEYTLYQSLAERDRLWDLYHVTGTPILGNAVWVNQGLREWSAKGGDFHLSLVQSNTGVSAEWVHSRVAQYLENCA